MRAGVVLPIQHAGPPGRNSSPACPAQPAGALPAAGPGESARGPRNAGAARPPLHVPDGFVGEEGDAVIECLDTGEAHGFLVADPAKEALAVSEHDRVDLQPQLVDEVVLNERAQELEAAGDDDIPVELLLQLRDFGHHVALEY